MPSDAVYTWGQNVSGSQDEAAGLSADIDDLRHKLNDLLHTIRDLETARFDDVEDYEILEKARGLKDLVARSVSSVRSTIHNAGNQLYDLRRAVEFYNH